MSHNRLEHDIKKKYLSEPDGRFSALSNEELAALVYTDAGTAAVNSRAFAELLNRFADMMLAKIACTRYSGMDADDLMQECSVGLLDAARDYDPSKGASFATFASVCVSNRIRDTLRSASARKNIPLENFEDITDVSVPEPADPLSDPESRFIIQESVGELRSQIVQRLTPVEYAVFFDYFNGLSYEVISRRQGITSKAVDNALQRARRKLKSLFLSPVKGGKGSKGGKGGSDGKDGTDGTGETGGTDGTDGRDSEGNDA